MKKEAVKEILDLLPEQVQNFTGSEYPLPINTTFLGHNSIDIEVLRKRLLMKQECDVKELIEPLLLASELYEASCDDKADYFITDAALRGYVFTGSKWMAGWVLVLGGEDQSELIENLKQKNFMIFTDKPGISDTVYIGSRDTSPVYFLQMMVRYGLIWGRIAPGADHEMGHFLEKDMPGFVIICEDLPPLKYIITLGLMKLGAPAIVPASFPFPYGTRIVSDNVKDLVRKGVYFPNLRMQYYKDEVIKLPDFCNQAHANKKIVGGHIIGGNSNSFFCVKPSNGINKAIISTGELSNEIGILIEIENEHLSSDMSFIVEQAAIKSINFLPGIKAYEKEGIFYLEIGQRVSLNSTQLGEAIYWGIRLQYPRLEKIRINIIYDLELLSKEVKSIYEFKTLRRQFIKSMNAENTEQFCACTECRPFSLEHTCIITPERIPMCASRTYFTVKAATYFGISDVPYQRQSEEELPLKHVFNKGKILDVERGEYEGCNRIYRDMTNGKLQKVYLHSLRGFPQTSCGCFQNLAFWIEEVKGIAIMSRGSKAISPDGQTWNMLANRAGGKQSDGITGVSVNYIRSQDFLKGDGGLKNVVWVNSELHEKIKSALLPGQLVATEKEVETMGELKSFLGK